MKQVSYLLAAIAAGGMSGAAQAAVIFSAGNQQFDHQVNFVADQTDTFIQGDLQGTSPTRHFDFFAAQDPAGINILLHGQHGVAFVEGCAPASIAPACDAPHSFVTLTMTPDSGWGWSGMDWKLDLLNGVGGSNVSFTAWDQLGNTTTANFAVTDGGQNPFHLHTTGGDLVTQLVISIDAQHPLIDIKQISVTDTPIPLPGTAWLLGAGLLGWGTSRRRKSL